MKQELIDIIKRNEKPGELRPAGNDKNKLGGFMDTQKKYMNLRELSLYLGVSRISIYRMIRRRKLPFISLSKRMLRFNVQEIDKWMNKNEVKAPSGLSHAEKDQSNLQQSLNFSL